MPAVEIKDYRTEFTLTCDSDYVASNLSEIQTLLAVSEQLKGKLDYSKYTVVKESVSPCVYLWTIFATDGRKWKQHLEFTSPMNPGRRINTNTDYFSRNETLPGIPQVNHAIEALLLKVGSATEIKFEYL